MTGYRVELAQTARHWDEAARLQNLHVEWNRRRAAAILVKSPLTWTAREKHFIKTLAVSLEHQARIQREQSSAACVVGYREALSLSGKIGATQEAAICAFNLGLAYEELAEIRDLVMAEQWYHQCLDLVADKDHLGRARCLGQLGSVAYERFLDGRKGNGLAAADFGYLSSAEKFYKLALQLFPANAIEELAISHNQLGSICIDAGQLETALRHYREAIRCRDLMQDRIGTGAARSNAAVALARAGRFADARDWAQSALRDFKACENAEQEIVMTLKLLEWIESQVQETSPPS